VSSSREYIGAALDVSVSWRGFVGLGLVGAEADEGNIGAVWVLSSSLGVWGGSDWEPCQVNRFRDSLEKISVNHISHTPSLTYDTISHIASGPSEERDSAIDPRTLPVSEP
jgi:hypothetical protein